MEKYFFKVNFTELWERHLSELLAHKKDKKVAMTSVLSCVNGEFPNLQKNHLSSVCTRVTQSRPAQKNNQKNNKST